MKMPVGRYIKGNFLERYYRVQNEQTENILHGGEVLETTQWNNIHDCNCGLQQISCT